MKAELKNCPFCGSKAAYDPVEGIHVSCTKLSCPAYDFGRFVTDEEWNKRLNTWVRCEDHLPEVGSRVLVLSHGNVIEAVKCEGTGFNRFGVECNPTHWMPMPELDQGV